MRSGSAFEKWVKRNDRNEIDLAGLVLRADGSSLPVKVRNISYEGCLLEADTILGIGERVTIALPRLGEIRTQIRWATAEGRAGARFLLEEMAAGNQHSRVGL